MPVCAVCGATVPFGARFCASCSAPVDPGPAAAHGSPQYRAEPAWITRIRSAPIGLVIASFALVVMFVGLLLPWLSANALDLVHVSENGFNSWGWLSFAAWLAGLAIVVAANLRLGGRRRRSAAAFSNSLAGHLLVASGGAAILGAVLFWVTAPSGSIGIQVRIGSGLVVAVVGSLALMGAGTLVASPKLTAKLDAQLGRPDSS
ncbi:MAG: hypothetical protein ACRDX8_02325 [Acidimicrobiales bacterium]